MPSRVGGQACKACTAIALNHVPAVVRMTDQDINQCVSIIIALRLEAPAYIRNRTEARLASDKEPAIHHITEPLTRITAPEQYIRAVAILTHQLNLPQRICRHVGEPGLADNDRPPVGKSRGKRGQDLFRGLWLCSLSAWQDRYELNMKELFIM